MTNQTMKYIDNTKITETNITNLNQLNDNINGLTKALIGGVNLVSVNDYFNYKLFKLSKKYNKLISLKNILKGGTNTDLKLSLYPKEVKSEVGVKRNIPSNATVLLPSGKWKIKKENDNIIYIKDDGERYDIKLYDSRSQYVPNEDKYTQFNLLDKIYKLSELKLPEDCILIYDYNEDDFISVFPKLDKLVYGIPLIEYSTNNFILFYSPNTKTVYNIDLLNDERKSFTDTDIISFQHNINQISEMSEQNKINLSGLNNLNEKALALEKDIKSITESIATELNEFKNTTGKQQLKSIGDSLKEIENKFNLINK